MASIKAGGKEYGLRFDLYAMEQIEEAFGSVRAVFELMNGGKQLKATKTLFKVLANSYLSYEGKEETVTGDEIKHADVQMISEISKAIRQAIEEGTKSETTDGNEADDQVHDMFMEEIERKNG